MAICALLMTLILPGAVMAAQPQQSAISLEYAVKATYLYKLAPFVNWPPKTFSSPNAPFEICVLGHDPFDGFLEKAVDGHWLGAHQFKVRKLNTAAQGAECQIVFIGHMSAKEVRETLLALSGRPVLTVTDSNDPDSSGSIVRFVLDQGHVRFDVDNAAAVRNHLTISSKLLSLALNATGAG